MRIRLSENFRAAFYAPFYATLALGHFAAEGVDIALADSAMPGSGTNGLVDGTIDVTWGGPMRAMKAADEGSLDLVCFAEVVRRDPFYLVGPAGSGPLALADLARLKLGSVAEVPTPWLCLQHDLREAGIDPGRVVRVADRGMAENLAALSRGEIDVAQMFEPFAAMAVAQGLVIRRAASDRGPTSYTTFLTTRRNLDRHRAAFAAMTRAVGRTQAWLGAASGAEIARVVSPWFAAVPQTVLAAAYDRYKSKQLWATDTAISRQGFDRLARSLQSGGFIASLPAYEACTADLLAG